MRGWIGKAGILFGIMLCMGVISGCASRQGSAGSAQRASLEEEQAETAVTASERTSQERFYEEANRQGIDRQAAEGFLCRLLADNIFQDGEMVLTGLRIDDFDGNGRTDMLVMLMDTKKPSLYASYGYGGLWFYMNEDAPCYFTAQSCPFDGRVFDVFWADLDNDTNVEIVFSAQGTGYGVVGDYYKAVFKYRDHAIEQMRIPSDFEMAERSDCGDCGLEVEVFQEPEADQYRAYCPYLDETVSFRGQNVEGWALPAAEKYVGNEVRGFFNLRVAEYEGKKVLQVSEYLHGEGGNTHGVGEAQFLITWDKDGTPQVLRWWVEEYGNTWANWRENRICYADGYYYYVSQMDHYFLYRVREDGSGAQCLVKAHAGGICVQDDEVFFINQTDGYGIYRMKTDGTGLTKLCDRGSRLQISAEYVYFCDQYHAEYDVRGLVTEETSEYDKDFLYRMKKDGTKRELITTDVQQYVLYDGRYQNVRYAGDVYCCRRQDDATVISRMDFDGQNENALCTIEHIGNILIYGSEIFGVGYWDDEGTKISQVSLRNGETRSFLVPDFKDCCIYKGYFYAMREQVTDDVHCVVIEQVDWDDGSSETVYRNEYSCEDAGWETFDLFATGCGFFFRQYVSEHEGCQWFRLTDDKGAVRWEDANKVPGTLPARYIEYGAADSVKSVLESTEGYEAYLSTKYEEYHSLDENREVRARYYIQLPEFNNKIPGFEKINQYFQRVYKEALEDRDKFFNETGGDYGPYQFYRETRYDYVYIDEKYITVAVYRGSYTGGIRAWTTQKPVTFDRETGAVVTLEELLGMTAQEASARLTASAYKYLEGRNRGWFFLRDENKLAEEFDPEKFFLFSEGVGIYYEQYAVDCGAAGDYLFVIPWEELNR